MSVEDRVRKVIADEFGIKNIESLPLETDVSKDLGLCSLDRVELIMALEEEFDMEIDDFNQLHETHTTIAQLVEVFTPDNGAVK